jgi:hypothetical protein
MADVIAFHPPATRSFHNCADSGRDFATIERTYHAMQAWLPISNPNSIATSTGLRANGKLHDVHENFVSAGPRWPVIVPPVLR